MFVSMAAMGLYNSRQRSRLAGLLARVAASVLGGAMVIAVIFYLFPALHIERGALLLSRVVAFGAVAIVRIVFDTHRRRRRLQAPRPGLRRRSSRGEHRPAAPPLGSPRLRRRRLRAGGGR